MSRPRIVVGVDGSAGSAAALAWALEEARLRGAEVEAVHAWHMSVGATYTGAPIAAGILVGVAEEDARALLDRMVRAARGAVERGAGEVPVRMVTVCDGADHALLQEADGADLLVVGARGHGGLSGALLGSVADDITRLAPCPVAVVRPGRGSRRGVHEAPCS